MTVRPDVNATLSKLKDFQRRSVDYVYRRFYEDQDHALHFLLADEVGLGKTVVARGVVARAVEHLWDRVDRIDIVYICSNADIARQNINRLRLSGQDDFSFASRLTLLPLHMKELAGRKLNFISFTPGTSFELGRRGGIVDERALLYIMLNGIWQFSGVGPKNVLQGTVQNTHWWRGYLETFEAKYRAKVDQKIVDAFARELRHNPGVRERFDKLCEMFARDRTHIPWNERNERNQVLGELRRLLARCCVRELQPDLVILDEFQRFKKLLHGDDEVAQLAKELFHYKDHEGQQTRVLLLSATPYKMYTLSEETEKEDHYSDFLKTAEFLFQSAAEVAAFQRDIQAYRTALCAPEIDLARLATCRAAIEARLRRVMCRTERLSVSADRNGMLKEVTHATADVRASDIASYAWVDRVSGTVDAGECLELWKSGAYLLNFMEEYQLKKKIRGAARANEPALRKALKQAAKHLFQSREVQRYGDVDLGNARLRDLVQNSIGRDAWRLLWMPASLPYYAPSGVFADSRMEGFTKSLVFSSWHVVPKVIAVMASYEAERRMVRAGDSGATYNSLTDRHKPLLRFAQSDGRLTGLSLLTLLYPCVTLSEKVDPLEIAKRLGSHGLPSSSALMSEARAIVAGLMEPILARVRGATVDERWYWAAPFLLDRKWKSISEWMGARDDGAWRHMAGREKDEETRFGDHLDEAIALLEKNSPLGRPPDDLMDVLTKVAIASPAVTALRALQRQWQSAPEAMLPAGSGDDALEPSERLPLLTAAAKMAMGFRSMFNRPESILLLRSLDQREPYWERILDYCLAGNLQAVMDEYVHMLAEGLGLDQAPATAALDLAQRVSDAVALRTVTLSYDDFDLSSNAKIEIKATRMRCRYALRFGEGEPEDGEEATREDQVRNAFNSPFRPFILASTSVGQEGLDFHHYCRAVYHWNLPSNPVDLEQREGRVHRYKGHVIRQNIAGRYGLKGVDGQSDPWNALFARALAEREPGASDMVPYWVAPGAWSIERRVPLFPLSREVARLSDLKRSLALYRLVFGQPRQEDLLRLLARRVDEGDKHLLQAQINLMPT